MKGKVVFVTGTDTDVGKTWASVALMRAWQAKGYVVAGMKPVAAGCVERGGRLVNDDAERLRQHASVELPYEWVNPYAFKMPVSPHLACGEVQIELSLIDDRLRSVRDQAEVVIIEGAGGWFSPLDNLHLNADLARNLDVPVLLVVGLRLGCINHALLSWHAIKDYGLRPAGWLAVVIDPRMSGLQSNIHFLQQHLGSPPVAVLPNLPAPDWSCLAAQIELDMLKL